MDHGEKDENWIFYEADMHKRICKGQRESEHTENCFKNFK